MTDEEFYDAEVAPLLLKAAKACEARGLPMACWAGYDKETGAGGVTKVWPDDWPDMGRRPFVLGALHARTLDDLVIGYVRWARENKVPHSSVVMKLMGLEPAVKDRD